MSETVNTPASVGDGIPEVTFTVQVAEVVQAPIDPTLQIEGMAADARAVGLAIAAAKAELQEEIDAVDEDVAALAGLLFPVGSICATTSDTAPTFGGANWNWKEILIPVTQGDLMDGTRSAKDREQGDPAGTIHFWVRIADTVAAGGEQS